MYRKHNIEKRLIIVHRLLDGEPLMSICRELKLDPKMVSMWRMRYEKYGEDGLRGTRAYHYTSADKLHIVEEYTKKGLTLHQICLLYDIAAATLKRWIKKAREEKSLENKKRGLPPNDMARPKKREPLTELEKLQAENLRLRAENALLKKVRTLVEEQQARARLNGQKPSTH